LIILLSFLESRLNTRNKRETKIRLEGRKIGREKEELKTKR
jgi:hypothetical protein